jgi:phosphoserine/homoserine phosphotransferase
MYIVCSDLEGVFIPEIWINVAMKTGIEELKLTTRDISDYDILMRRRLEILRKNRLRIQDIRQVISGLNPLPGAVEFVNWLRSHLQLIIVSDTFMEFANPLMEQLGWPTLFCHNLTTDDKGNITNYILRQKNAKENVVKALKGLNFKVIAIGDSYNDIPMLKKADHGFLFNPPQNVINEYPDLQVITTYDKLEFFITKMIRHE